MFPKTAAKFLNHTSLSSRARNGVCCSPVFPQCRAITEAGVTHRAGKWLLIRVPSDVITQRRTIAETRVADCAGKRLLTGVRSGVRNQILILGESLVAE